MKKLAAKINKVLNTKWVEILIVLLILFGAFGVRLYKITNPIADWHSWRQADTSSVSRIYFDEGINLLRPKYYDISSIQTGYWNPEGLRMVEFPVFNVIQIFVARLFVNYQDRIPNFFEASGRLVSVVASMFSIFLVYKIGKELYGKWMGLFSGFFFAFIPYNIYFTRVVLPEPLGVTFGLAGIWFFIVYLRREKTLPLLVSGVFLSSALLIKPFLIFYAVPMIYLASKKMGGVLKTFKRSAWLYVYLAIALVPFFAWRTYENNFLKGIPHFVWAFNGDAIRFKPSFWEWIFVERIGKLILGTWGLIPFAFGFLNPGQGKAKWFNHFFLLGMFLYVSLVATASVRHDYYQIFLIPVVALTLGRGVEVMLKGNWMTKCFLAFSLFLMLLSGAYQAREFYKINHYQIVESGQKLDEIAPKDAKVIASYNGDTAFLYQTKRYGWPVVETNLDWYIKDQGADYFVSVNWGDPDTKTLSEKYKTVAQTTQWIIIDLNQPITQ